MRLLGGIIKKLSIGIALNAGALYVVVNFLENVTQIGGWKFYLTTGIIIGILNTIVKPALKIISLPVIVLSAGLFLIVINALILLLTEKITLALNFESIAFQITGFFTYFTAALIFGLVNWFEHIFIKNS